MFLKLYLELYYRSMAHYIAMVMFAAVGYGTFMKALLDFNTSTPGFVRHTAPCQNRCEAILPNSSVNEFNSFSLDNSQVLFVHFHGNSLSRLQKPKETEILDPVNLVWVENTTAPFLSLDLAFNVYSMTTLRRKVHSMSVMVEFGSQKCLENITYSCVTASLATAFLAYVSQQRGALCYVANFNSSVKYKCCQKNFHTQKIECNIPASINPEMSRVFVTIIIVAAIFFGCFPAVSVRFPDKDDTSQTMSANVQVRNPFYRMVNFAVQKLRHYSNKHYSANVIRKLLIGCLLPTLFYIDWGLVVYTAKYDIPKMFNDAVRKNWLEKKMSFVVFAAVSYSIVLLILSLLPRYENLNFSFAPAHSQETVQHEYSLIREAQSQYLEMDWMKPCSFARNLFMKFCFGFKGLFDFKSFLCLKIIKFVCSFLLVLILFPIVFVLIFIGYGWYISPLGRSINILISQAFIYVLWFSYRFVSTLKKILGNVAVCIGVVLGMVLSVMMSILTGISFAKIVSRSLLLIARLITYLCMGIVASKDDYLPLIALFSLFVFYIWNCFSSVGNTYKDLLRQTFDMCKEYQEKENRQVIIVDNEGVPRIDRLSVLFQKVVDKILPFSKTYTIMFVKMAIIGSFLFLTYFSILVYGKTSLNDVTKTLAVSLAGLIPKLIEIFRSGNSKDLIDRENAYKIEKIVQEFFDSEQGDQGSNGETSESSTTNLSNGTGEARSEGRHQLVRADVNPRLTDINGDPTNETTPLIQSNQNARNDIIEV
ncbi:uncharacterized protein LOC114575957 isoform X1 [Exaiptasia diaphana]|uniref:Uncharacterized protein n=1 Tax=Exaiptasia diaphana TaxID=2652724 RepID=A0A913YR19_EXADI|nr:uncharacterized protein LOC114575957 isoform X1 [Exaiptasia diaphana]